MSKSSKLRRFAQSLLVIVLVALSCFANGLEQQQQTLPSSSQPIRRRPFSGGKTRLTSSLPTEGVVIERSIKRRPSRILVPVVGLSCINVVFNMMRPDPDVGVIVSSLLCDKARRIRLDKATLVDSHNKLRLFC